MLVGAHQEATAGDPYRATTGRVCDARTTTHGFLRGVRGKQGTVHPIGRPQRQERTVEEGDDLLTALRDDRGSGGRKEPPVT